MRTLFRNGNILIEGKFKNHVNLAINKGTIDSIYDQSDLSADYKSEELLDIFDLEGGYLVPALLDLQLYGTEGHFFGGDPTVENLAGMEEYLIKQGLGGFLATVATNTDELVLKAIRSAKTFRSSSKGAFLGLHLEGPFLNPLRKGAHPDSLIRKANLEEVAHWLELAAGEIKMMTVAPELQDEAVLNLLRKHNVVLSVGHSNATYQEANDFLAHPITAATHLFNAMPSLHHRNPGLILSILEKKPFASIIPDGIHVSYPMIALAKRELSNKLFLITDAVASSTQGIYQHQLNKDHFETPDGILSGSSISLLTGVRNCIQHVDIDPAEAFAMASEIPARVLGIDNSHGMIAKGRKANLLWLDKNFELKKVWFTFTG